MSEPKSFDPGSYLTKVGSSDYLEVKWRLVWFRQEHPNASINTELVSHADRLAIFKATISIADGGSATGYGSEGFADFREYIEKAETKAIGRALAALGYGTQFCPDFDFGNGQGNVVDAPIDFARTRGRRSSQQSSRPLRTEGMKATPPQIKGITNIAREQGITDEQLDKELLELFGKPVADLGFDDAAAYITRIQKRKSQTAIAS